MSTAIDEVQTRLSKLRADYERGRLQLQDLVEQETALREALLRISGAIQVLEELASASASAERAKDNGVPAPVLHVP